MINDLYAFEVTGTDPLTTIDSVNSSFATAGAQIQNFRLSLFKNSGTLAMPEISGPALATAIANFTPGATTGSQFAGLPAIHVSPLPDGNYVLQVVGQVVDPSQYVGSFQFSTDPLTIAPLPASVALFAAGLGVFGVFGRQRIRRRTVPAAG
jgi:hypothetical protein